jgi:NADPH-dependent glutamate synthase beta subunit-like oxidoreductase
MLDARGNVEGRHQHLSHQRRQDLCLRRHAPWLSLVVWAIREGRQAARAVDEALMVMNCRADPARQSED